MKDIILQGQTFQQIPSRKYAMINKTAHQSQMLKISDDKILKAVIKKDTLYVGKQFQETSYDRRNGMTSLKC